MSGGEADVKNSIWMRAVLYGGVFLAVGILAFATMSVGVANVKQAEWDEEKLNYERVTEQYTEATADYTQANETYTHFFNFHILTMIPDDNTETRRQLRPMIASLTIGFSMNRHVLAKGYSNV